MTPTRGRGPTTRRVPAPPAPPPPPEPSSPAPPPVNIGPCGVAGCAAPAVREIVWPAAKPQKLCGPHAEDALAGRLKAK